jgi:hypothetical protein
MTRNKRKTTRNIKTIQNPNLIILVIILKIAMGIMLHLAGAFQAVVAVNDLQGQTDSVFKTESVFRDECKRYFGNNQLP